MNKVYIYDRGCFWTGLSWTNVRQFAKEYRIDDALIVILKRFNKNPRPRMRLVKDFIRKKNEKEKKNAPRKNDNAV